MSRNQFDPRFGKKPAQFIGHEDILRDITAMLDDPDEENRTIIISGIKGSGKTAMFSEIRSLLDSSQIVVVGAGMTEADLQENASIEDSLPIVYFADDVDKDMPGFASFVADFFADKSSSDKANSKQNSRLVLAGLPHAIDDLLKDKNFDKLKSAFRITLSNIHTDEVLMLFSDTVADNEKNEEEIDQDVLQRAAEATLGYPYLIQLIGYYLSKEENGIDDKAVDRAIFRSKIELYKNIHEPLVWSLSSKDRMFLWAMAQDEGASEFGEIAKRMDVSTGYASKYRERLIGADVIYSSAYGELAFTLPYMKEYIEKEYVERFGGEGGKRRL